MNKMDLLNSLIIGESLECLPRIKITEPSTSFLDKSVLQMIIQSLQNVFVWFVCMFVHMCVYECTYMCVQAQNRW